MKNNEKFGFFSHLITRQQRKPYSTFSFPQRVTRNCTKSSGFSPRVSTLASTVDPTHCLHTTFTIGCPPHWAESTMSLSGNRNDYEWFERPSSDMITVVLSCLWRLWTVYTTYLQSSMFIAGIIRWRCRFWLYITEFFLKSSFSFVIQIIYTITIWAECIYQVNNCLHFLVLFFIFIHQYYLSAVNVGFSTKSNPYASCQLRLLSWLFWVVSTQIPLVLRTRLAHVTQKTWVRAQPRRTLAGYIVVDGGFANGLQHP